jgi:TRAP-type C4-dicarboxylate transport system permease small subunit
MLPLAGKKICKLISDLTVLACCVLLTIGGWQIVKMNMVNIAPISEIPLGVVYLACLFCSVGMGVLLLGSIYRLLSGTMTEQEMCPDFDDAL